MRGRSAGPPHPPAWGQRSERLVEGTWQGRSTHLQGSSTVSGYWKGAEQGRNTHLHGDSAASGFWEGAEQGSNTDLQCDSANSFWEGGVCYTVVLGHREGAYNPCPKWARIYRLMTESGSKAFPASRAP